MGMDSQILGWDEVASRFDDYYAGKLSEEDLVLLQKDSQAYADAVEEWADSRYDRDHEGDSFWTDY